MVPCLVFNGRRAEFDYSLYKGEYPRIIDQDIEIFQREVNCFKDIVFSSMLKVMSYILLCRQNIQQQVLVHIVYADPG